VPIATGFPVLISEKLCVHQCKKGTGTRICPKHEPEADRVAVPPALSTSTLTSEGGKIVNRIK